MVRKLKSDRERENEDTTLVEGQEAVNTGSSFSVFLAGFNYYFYIFFAGSLLLCCTGVCRTLLDMFLYLSITSALLLLLYCKSAAAFLKLNL